MSDTLEIGTEGRLRVLRLNRPERKNALTAELAWSVVNAVTEAAHDDEVSTWTQILQVYEPLIALDSDLKLVPQLATAWRLVEPTVWEFELRPKVRFHDGTPLTAEDVVGSWLRLIDPAHPSPLAALMIDVRGARAHLTGQ